MSQETRDEYIDRTLGFPVTIKNAPMREFRGEWILDIPPSRLESKVVWRLVTSRRPLTGNHVRFLRHWLDETQTAFGAPLDVSAAAVSKWEARADKPTRMNKSTEFQLRMRAARHLLDQPHVDTTDFRDIYDRAADFDTSLEPHQLASSA